MNIMVHRILGTRFPLVLFFLRCLGNIKNRSSDKGCFWGWREGEFRAQLPQLPFIMRTKDKGERE